VRFRFFGIAAFLSGIALAGGPPEFHVRDGDTVVFYGDSITSARLYTDYTEAYVLTRFPQIHVKFVHSGWSGDRVSGGGNGPIDVRLDRDVFAYHPTVITIMLGMNDGEYRPFDADIFEIFKTGYRHILDTIKEKAPDARVTVLEPSPYDDFTRAPLFAEGYNSVLLRYGAFVRETGRARGLTIADLNAPVAAVLKVANLAAPKPAQGLIPDRVHPSAGVHLVMAEALLRAWNATPVVSAVEIDGSTGAVVKAENTAVDSVSREEGLSWTQVDRALPMPVEADEETVALALRYSDFTEALNRETLKITGLEAGNYPLEIDGEVVGTFDARKLQKGFNLATLNTRMARQARTVLDLTYRHNHLRYARLMLVEQALQEYHPAKLGPAIEALDALHDEVVSMQRAEAQPKPHRYRLTRIASQ
jgi:lysophospholipase L1-like esterase